VLGSLLADAEAALGYRPVAAVISTPALFELPQNHATMTAGRLAGLSEVALIQEPIASAIAAGWRADAEGHWLVYDLGGGTLDVSLLETRDGWLRVVDHGGDNFLGGKDFDNALTDWAAARLAEETGLPPLSRSNPGHRRALGKLKAACEQAKIDLSRLERTAVVCAEVLSDPAGHPVDADLPVTRQELEELVSPLLERTLGVCRTLLERNRLGAEAVGRVVFVGGPTLMPALRDRVGALFGGQVVAEQTKSSWPGLPARRARTLAPVPPRPAAAPGGFRGGRAAHVLVQRPADRGLQLARVPAADLRPRRPLGLPADVPLVGGAGRRMGDQEIADLSHGNLRQVRSFLT
jgi:molecular chaperone DnaK